MDNDWLVQPALAEPVDSDGQALLLLSKEGWHAEQKLDGVRLLIHVHEGKIIGINRKGAITLIPDKVADAFAWFDGEWVLDGELVKNTYWVFDLVRAMDVVTPAMPYTNRRDVLEQLWPQLLMPDCVQLLRSAREPEDRAALALDLKEARCEGVMLKNGAAPYRAGKRTKDTRKWKYVNDVDCIVMATGIDGKQNLSVGLVVPETGEIIEVATVTALAGDGMKAQVGDVVTVKCLYASEDNRLVQPTKPMLRDDKSPKECLFSQLESIKTNKDVLV